MTSLNSLCVSITCIDLVQIVFNQATGCTVPNTDNWSYDEEACDPGQLVEFNDVCSVDCVRGFTPEARRITCTSTGAFTTQPACQGKL